MEIFTSTPPDPDQDALLTAMEQQWHRDVDVIKSQGRIPDWYGEPYPLEKSLARVLNYTYEEGSFAWDARATPNNRRMTAAFGFRSPVNAYDAVFKCHELGLIEYDGGLYYMTQKGEYALEEWHLEAEVSEMDVCNALAGFNDEWDVNEEFAKLWGIDK